MKGQGIVEYALILVLVAVVVIVLIEILTGAGSQHKPNEFCRTDTIDKMTYETCITPAYPMPTRRSAQ